MKYIVNKTKIAYRFLNGNIIGRRGTLSVEDAALEELRKDFYFKGLVERGALAISEQEPKSINEASEKIASKDSEIAELRKQLMEAQEKIAALSSVTETSDMEKTASLDTLPETAAPKKSRSKKASSEQEVAPDGDGGAQ